MKRKLLFFSIMMILMSCSTTKKGPIVAKRYEPARYETRAAGAGFTARTYKIHDDEDYVIFVGLERRSGRDYQKKVYLTKEAYDSLSIDQEYLIEKRRKSNTADKKESAQVSISSTFLILFMSIISVFVLSA